MLINSRLTKSLIIVCFLWMFIMTQASAVNLINRPEPHPTAYEKHWTHNFIQDIKHDFIHYFEEDNLIFLGDSFLAAGLLANTGLDRGFRQHWQNDIRSSTTNTIFAFPKAVGGLSYYYAPIYLLSMGIGHLREHTLVGNTLYAWGYRSVRTFIVGGIQQIFLTNLLGSGRPNRNEDSKWQPFKYQTGVSGHAFYGAIPFISAAMMSDPPLLKYGLYFFSTLPGFSRINSDRHYLSQVILGWTLAYLSARSVYATDMERDPPFQMRVYPKSQGAMLDCRLKF